jgi:hypothetical protein
MSYLELARQALRDARKAALRDVNQGEKSEKGEKTPPTSEPFDSLPPLDGEEPSVWRVIRLRPCMAYNRSTFCVSNPRHPELCVHCGRALSPEEQGNPYEPL